MPILGTASIEVARIVAELQLRIFCRQSDTVVASTGAARHRRGCNRDVNPRPVWPWAAVCADEGRHYRALTLAFNVSDSKRIHRETAYNQHTHRRELFVAVLPIAASAGNLLVPTAKPVDTKWLADFYCAPAPSSVIAALPRSAGGIVWRWWIVQQHGDGCCASGPRRAPGNTTQPEAPQAWLSHAAGAGDMQNNGSARRLAQGWHQRLVVPVSCRTNRDEQVTLPLVVDFAHHLAPARCSERVVLPGWSPICPLDLPVGPTCAACGSRPPRQPISGYRLATGRCVAWCCRWSSTSRPRLPGLLATSLLVLLAAQQRSPAVQSKRRGSSDKR